MNSSQTASGSSTDYELCFRSLYNGRSVYAFPCDASGNVNMDTLGDRARCNYLYVRIGIGHEFSVPAVRVATVA